METLQEQWIKNGYTLPRNSDEEIVITQSEWNNLVGQIISETLKEAVRVIEGEIENFADTEHERWSKWQSYLHSKLKYVEYQPEEGGHTYAGYLMNAGDYEHWSRQIDTPYSDLSEAEKESDREQVRPYITIMKEILTTITAVEGLGDKK